jgi:hypothetical protein
MEFWQSTRVSPIEQQASAAVIKLVGMEFNESTAGEI